MNSQPTASMSQGDNDATGIDFAAAQREVARVGFGILNRVVKPLVKAGLGNPWPIGFGVTVLETTGRVSGLPREVPLVSVRVGDCLAVSTVRTSSQWLSNAEADPEVGVWLGGKQRRGNATVTRGPLSVATIDLNDD